MKFLFVEDEIELLELYEIFLDDMNVNYSLAKDGLEALELLAKDKYDYIFSDIRMPNMDGFELLQAIQNKEISVKSFVFITANVDVSREEASSKGASDILYKPLPHKKLKLYIEELLGDSK
ncbi:response regulator [Bacteriovorax sp. Seq25_V]|uniref:response regulator n=1 Tax=Bacteriovorax sp. Seq25_V TaxID=1201288 RepID=UPI000389FEBA|nr:response regulator [Bacteriovorax sp. Seq25_V]EQC44346.1 response regulator receiver domain protein [Bacteriovorax sp. Seq25_V]